MQPEEATGIRFDNVTVQYKGGTALKSFSLAVQPGEIMALIGPSGSGKTTALRTVAGFVTPTQGRVHIGDRDVTDMAPRDRHIGMVVQQYALFPHMRVYENVAFGLRAQHVDKAKIEPRVRESLRLVGMQDYADRYPRELSGGQQQRVSIARALAVQPRVLLLDEPLSALDAQLRSGVINEIARLHRELPDLTILYVTHDQSEALILANRITIMHDTQLVDVGTARNLYERPPSPFTAGFLGNANLIPARLTSHDAQAGKAEIDLGQHVCRVLLPEHVETSGRHLLCVRPHALRLESAEHCKNRITGKLMSAQWLGSQYRLFLEVEGCEIRVDATSMRTLPELGAELALHFADDDAILLRAEED
jgi:2-aminoethylphosphonate transport system ATP-binding protein